MEEGFRLTLAPANAVYLLLLYYRVERRQRRKKGKDWKTFSVSISGISLSLRPRRSPLATGASVSFFPSAPKWPRNKHFPIIADSR